VSCADLTDAGDNGGARLRSGADGGAFVSLVKDYPGPDVYAPDAFRVEWGPIFHRGRLDGSARLLVIGQDPAQSEAIVRRILVGEAGHRTQGLMAKLGVTRSYVMVNTYVYSVYGQQAGEQHIEDAEIARYRNRWLEAIFDANAIDAVIALGHLADRAWQTWKQTPAGAAHQPAYRHVTHPTQPESSSARDPTKLPAALAAMLANWNEALAALRPRISSPDVSGPLVRYGAQFTPAERVDIPELDIPAGVPAWMRSAQPWASRDGATAAARRRNVTITVPAGVVAA
jgi:uracil-DNA glycosylase